MNPADRRDRGPEEADRGRWLIAIDSPGRLGAAEPARAPRVLRSAPDLGVRDGFDGILAIAGGRGAEGRIEEIAGAALAGSEGPAVPAGIPPFALVASPAGAGIAAMIRDPLGRMPLFVRRGEDETLVSPDLDALASEGPVPALDRGTMVGHLAHLWSSRTETYRAGITRVPAGHALLVDAEGERLARYWDPGRLAPLGGVTPGPEELTDLLQTAVSAAVAGRQAGIYLSGGLDSVSVAALACRRAREEGLVAPIGLSVGFSGSGFDELETQRAVAAELGIRQRILDHRAIGDGDPISAVLELAATMPAPPQNVFLPAFIELGAAGVREGCEVTLTGTGGDEWLGVTPLLAADLLRRGRLAALWRLYATLHRSHPIGRRRAARTIFWKFGFAALARQQAGIGLRRATPALAARITTKRGLAGLPAWIAPGADGRILLEERALAAAAIRREYSAGGIYHREARDSLAHPIASAELEEAFEHGRRIGAPIEHPYLDPALVSLLYGAPPEWLSAGRRSKAPVRALVESELPGLGFGRQRKPLATSYVRDLLTSLGVPAYHRLGGARTLAVLEVVDPRGAGEMVGRIERGEASLEECFRLWDLLGLEAWARPRADVPAG